MDDLNNEIFLKVKNIICEVLNLEEEKITYDSKLLEDLGAESLDIITLLIEFEDKFQRKIPEDDVGKLLSVRDIVQYISQQA
jgi:acyl carrier protein